MMNFLMRISSAILLLPIVIGALFLGGLVMRALIWAVFAVGFYEYARMVFHAHPRRHRNMTLIGAAFMCAALLCSVAASLFQFPLGMEMLLPLSFLMTTIVGTLFVLNPSWLKEDFGACISTLAVIPFIGVGLFSIDSLRQISTSDGEGLAYILVALISIWSSDTFAYLTGKAIGRHKMCPNVSPSKTWEGFFGGAIFTVAIPFFIQWLFTHTQIGVFTTLTAKSILMITLPTTMLAPLGDLIESRMKRLFEVKDSGGIFPGHGGMLDRIDSILLVMPWVYVYVAFFQ